MLSSAGVSAVNGLSDKGTEQTPLEQAVTAAAVVRASVAWRALRSEIVAHAVHFTEHLVFDFRRLLTQARPAAQAGQLLWQIIRPLAPQVLIGPGFGAAPLLFGIAHAALADGVELQVLMVRDKRKQHNQKKWIEGRVPEANARAVLVDDFMRAGSAVELVQAALQAEQITLSIQVVLLFFDMWQPLGSRQISLSQYPVLALFKRHDIGLSRDCFDAKPPLMRGSYPEFLTSRLWWRWGLNEKASYPHKCVPVIAENAVFVADDHCRVWRHDGSNGDIVWAYTSLDDPLKGIVQLLQYAQGSLVFGCYDGTLTRLDARTGAVLWRWRQDSSIHATPALDLARGRVFVNTEQWNEGQPFGHLQALDWESGKQLWRYRQAYWPPGSPVYEASREVVLATCNDQTLLALAADNGTRRWRQSTRGLVRGRPAVAQDRVIVATEKGWLQAFELGTGELLWQVRYGAGARHQFVLVQGEVVYALDSKWHLSAFAVRDGSLVWLSRLRSPGCWMPLVVGRYLLVLSRNGDLAVFDPAQQIKVWEGKIPGRFQQPPAVGWLAAPDGSRQMVLAAASNDAGLQVWGIGPEYWA